MTALQPTPGTTMLCGCGHAEWAACGLEEMTTIGSRFGARGWCDLPDHSHVCPACAKRIRGGDRPAWFEGWLAGRVVPEPGQGALL